MKGAVCDEAYNHRLNTMKSMKGRVWDECVRLRERQIKHLYSDEEGLVCGEGRCL